ncbi:MAG: hypothetical protein ACKVI4_16780, partial [Actinomycetales bacterium]
MMMLIREFRLNWGFGNIVTNDDMEFIRVCMDVALSEAIRLGHTSTIYDMSPTVWAMWMVQNVLATRTGGWQVQSRQQQLRWCLAGMYAFLEAMHARGDRLTLRDPATKATLHRYKLPFQTRMNVPPRPSDAFKWRKGAQQLSNWMVSGGLAPLNPGIIQLLPPTIVPLPALASQRADRAAAVWQRIGQRSRQYELQSVPQGGDDAGAQEARQVVGGVMAESRAAAAAAGGSSSSSEQGMSDEAADEMERELEGELDAQQQQQQQPSDDEPPVPQNQLVSAISEMLDEMTERGEGFEYIEP